MLPTPRFVIIGYVNHDINRYPDGSVKSSVGGGAYFAALAASRVLPDVGLVTRVGHDFDLGCINRYLNCQAVRQLAEGKTASSIQTYNDPNDLSDRSIQLEPGVNPQIGVSDIPDAWMESVHVVLVSTMIPQQQVAIVSELVRSRRDRGFQMEGMAFKAPLIAVDSDLCWLQSEESAHAVRRLMSMADIAFMNRAEGKILEDLIPQIPLVVLKRDADGAEIYQRGVSRVHIPAPQVEVVDVTGAGDVFAGTFLAHVACGTVISHALEAAVRIASRSVTKEGVAHLL